MNKKFTIKNTIVPLFYKKESWMLIIGVGFILKLFLFPIRLGDYNTYLEPWINFIKQNGYFSALQYDFYNYSPSYIYFLVGIAKIGLNPLFSMKLLSVVFEFVLAFFIGKIAYLKYKDPLVIWISLAIVPLLPTLILNGAYWGQCDSIYTTFVVGSIYFSLTKKPFLSCLFLGIAFAFKFQAIFILPFFFVMLLRGNIKWYYFLLIPIVYFISVLPPWFYGRSLTDLLLIYFQQSGYYEMLTLFFPNIYVWISNDYYEPVKFIGIAFTFVFTLFFGIWLSNKRYSFTFDAWIELAFLSAIIIPFLLPGMHERYLYLGDVLAVLYFIVFRKKIFLSAGIVSVSFYAYLCCSRLKEILPLAPAFFLYLVVIILVIMNFRKTIKNDLVDQKQQLNNE